MNWVRVGPPHAIPAERAVTLLLPDGSQVAVFRTHDDQVLAVTNRDPISGANVLARGIVGSRDGGPTVTSPMHKQVFCLVTGRCLSEPAPTLARHRIRDRGGVIWVDPNPIISAEGG
ncbi:MAG: nitrite reductase small subunit NirD [Candidatus Nanopelagicales bacterium]|nr:nitrite reductase small subunit NirD [Candidatus Nanopelagicales bacterium]